MGKSRKTQHITTVSDLHLFCRRSEAPRHQESISHAASQTDRFVLNGDIFDFRWSTLESTEHTVEAAIEWIDGLVSRAPNCHFDYVLGNHDHVQAFMDALDEYATESPNLSWHPYYLDLGTAIFLHGDVANRRMNAADLELYRENWLFEEQKGEFVNKVYDVAFKAGVHRALNRWAFPTNVIVNRLSHYLKDIGRGPGSITERVYFGHTHVALRDYRHKGQRYFNTGAPMPGLKFEILSAEIPVLETTDIDEARVQAN